MQLSDFQIGTKFECSGRRYRCTDVGSRVVVAIRIDEVVVNRDGSIEIFDYNRANKDGWFNGPPYAVTERVFDEYALPVCNRGVID